jgi:hypothetical protein
MIVLLLLLALFVGACVYGVRQYFGPGRERDFEERFVTSATPLLVVMLLMQLVHSVARMPHRDWNAARITPSVAWTKGYDVYYPADEGPILNTLYGPGTVLAFVPAALGRTPTAAVLIAGTVNVAAMSLPLLLLLLRVRTRTRHDTDSHLRWLVWALAGGMVYLYSGTQYAIDSIHADSPAMGLMVIAASLLSLPEKDRLSFRRMGAAAGIAALACFTKQIEVFALPGFFFFIGLTFNWRSAFVFAGMVAACAAGWAGLFGAGMGGFSDMMFNIVEVPSHHAWKGPRMAVLLKSGVALGLAAGFALLLLLPFLGWAFHRRRLRLEDARAVLVENRWFLFVFMAVTMIPGCLMGEVKVGGMENSYHSIYYLIAAGAMALLAWVTSAKETARPSLVLGVYLLGAVVVGLRAPGLINLLGLRTVGDNAQEKAFRFAKAHPGEAIFPWNPLSTLYADGKVYHFEYGVYDRVFAGYPPKAEHFARHLPERLKYIIWRGHRECYQIPGFLPAFNRRVNIAGLDEPLDRPAPAPPKDPMEPPELNETTGSGWMVMTRE